MRLFFSADSFNDEKHTSASNSGILNVFTYFEVQAELIITVHL